MSILGYNSSSNMTSQSSTPIFHEFKKQASFFFKEKIKTARLALTDVTPAQLMTEEATSGNPWAPDAKTLRLISKAAFEIDDYWRIVEILHRRLEKFDRKNWRPSYNALLVLENLMTHGPESVAKEFQDEKSFIREMQSFHHVDEKGFNWGFTIRKKCERILELLEKGPLLKEERNRARQVTRGIQGFGSFSKRVSSSKHGVLQESKTTSSFERSHSQFNEHGNQDDDNNDNGNGNGSDIRTFPSKKPVEKVPLDPEMLENQFEGLRVGRVSTKENMVPAREELHGWSSSETGDRNPLLLARNGKGKGNGNGEGNGNGNEDEDEHPSSAIESRSKLSLLSG